MSRLSQRSQRLSERFCTTATTGVEPQSAASRSSTATPRNALRTIVRREGARRSLRIGPPPSSLAGWSARSRASDVDWLAIRPHPPRADGETDDRGAMSPSICFSIRTRRMGSDPPRADSRDWISPPSLAPSTPGRWGRFSKPKPAQSASCAPVVPDHHRRPAICRLYESALAADDARAENSDEEPATCCCFCRTVICWEW